MSGDIVERLRALALHDDLSIGIVAADEIEQLTRERDEARAEVERLRAENDEKQALIDAARAHRNNLRAEIAFLCS